MTKNNISQAPMSAANKKIPFLEPLKIAERLSEVIARSDITGMTLYITTSDGLLVEHYVDLTNAEALELCTALVELHTD